MSGRARGDARGESLKRGDLTAGSHVASIGKEGTVAGCGGGVRGGRDHAQRLERHLHLDRPIGFERVLLSRASVRCRRGAV